MEVFEIDESPSKSDNKNKMSFLTSKGFKRSLTLLIILTIVSIIYTFINKLSTSSIETFFGKIYKQMSNMSPDQFENFVNFLKSSTMPV